VVGCAAAGIAFDRASPRCCSLPVRWGPTTEPEIRWLEDWQSDLYGKAPASAQGAGADLEFWWRLFDDAALNQLIETARAENPSLRIAGLRVLESRAFLGIAGSTLYPQVQQLGGALTYVNAQQHGGLAADRHQELTAYEGGLNLGWELDFWGRFRRGIESADAAFFASITNQQDAQVLLTEQVADLYFAWRTTELRIAIAHDNAERQKRSFEITERIYTSGQGSELDLQQAKTQYLATLATIPELEATLVQIRNALAALLGRPPGDLPELATVTGPLPAVEQSIVSDIPARLLLRRPDIRTAAWQVAASAQIGVARRLYQRSRSWRSAGRAATSASVPTDSLAIGPALTWNLFDYGRIRNNVRLQDATAATDRGLWMPRCRPRNRRAAITVVNRRQRFFATQPIAARRRSSPTRAIRSYADFQRVLEAQRVLFTQAERELINQGNQVGALIALYKALGGGWSPISAEELVPDDVRTEMQERTNWGDLMTAPLPVTAEPSPSRSRTSP
jgi:NodT family efflux transporter outer membrane factor (OMF) lipoprotein